jgi:glyoxylase-like metal-dependent hydrolase (beta-lactamase superfamily II)
MSEVIPGIYRLQIPIPTITPRHVNIYLVEGSTGYLLIDTGWDNDDTFNAVKIQIADTGVSLKEISRILITHIHPDHYGLAGRLRSLSNAQIYIHKQERDIIESRYINMDGLLQQVAQWLLLNGVPHHELAELQTASIPVRKFVAPVWPDVILYGSETITAGDFSFEVLWTPGHAPGHVCLYEPDRKLLFSGDHILPTITPNVGLHPQSSANPLCDYVDSLNRIKHLEVDLVLPGHEAPFTGLEKRITGIVEHHEKRNNEILRVIEAGPKTAYQVATKLTWSAGETGSWQNLDKWNKRLAVLETIAHLEAMRLAGEIDNFSGDGEVYYKSSDVVK